MKKKKDKPKAKIVFNKIAKTDFKKRNFNLTFKKEKYKVNFFNEPLKNKPKRSKLERFKDYLKQTESKNLTKTDRFLQHPFTKKIKNGLEKVKKDKQIKDKFLKVENLSKTIKNAHFNSN